MNLKSILVKNERVAPPCICSQLLSSRVLYLYYEASYLLIAPVVVCMNGLL